MAGQCFFFFMHRGLTFHWAGCSFVKLCLGSWLKVSVSPKARPALKNILIHKTSHTHTSKAICPLKVTAHLEVCAGGFASYPTLYTRTFYHKWSIRSTLWMLLHVSQPAASHHMQHLQSVPPLIYMSGWMSRGLSEATVPLIFFRIMSESQIACTLILCTFLQSHRQSQFHFESWNQCEYIQSTITLKKPDIAAICLLMFTL